MLRVTVFSLIEMEVTLTRIQITLTWKSSECGTLELLNNVADLRKELRNYIHHRHHRLFFNDVASRAQAIAR